MVNVTIRSATEVDALERAGRQRLRLEDLLHTQLTVSACDEGLPGLELHNFVHFEIEGGLQHRTLAGQGKNLVVLVPKRRTDAPRVAQHEGFAATRDAAHHITAVPHGGRLAEHVGHVDVLFDILRDVAIRQSQRLSRRKAAFRLAVQAVAQLFEQEISVAQHTRVLPFDGNVVENLLHIRHVEVRANAKIFGAPVVSAQKRVDIRKATLAGRSIPEVAHIDFPSKGNILAGKICIGKF